MSPKDLRPGMTIVERDNRAKITGTVKVQTVTPCTQPGATHVNTSLCYYNCANLEVRS